MKIDKVISDYQYVSNDCRNDGYSTNYDIKTYFANNSNNYSSLANNHGALAAKEYISYVTNLFFPLDGSWMGLQLEDNSQENQETGKKVLKKLQEQLIKSKFYREVSKFVAEGVLYNRSLLDVTYGASLQFQTVANEDIFISKESNDGARRCYTVTWKTAGELMEEFKGSEIISHLKSQPDLTEAEYNTHYKLISCILPKSQYFGTNGKNKFAYLKKYLLESEYGVEEVTKIGDEEDGYYSFPTLQYLGYSENSLAALSLPHAVRVNMYEQLIGTAARKFINPPHAIGLSTYKNFNNLDFRENSKVPVFPGEVMPTPIQTAGAINITRDDIKALMALIDRNFKSDIIQRTQITNLSQFEASLNEFNAIQAIAPECYDLVNVAVEVVNRVHDLLYKYNKEYAKIARGLKMNLTFGGLAAKINDLKKAIGVARVVQGIAPLLQADPGLLDVINGEQTFVNLVDCYKVPFMAKSEDEVTEAREAQADQVDQQQEQEAALNQADVAQKQASAQQTLT